MSLSAVLTCSLTSHKRFGVKRPQQVYRMGATRLYNRRRHFESRVWRTGGLTAPPLAPLPGVVLNPAALLLKLQQTWDALAQKHYCENHREANMRICWFCRVVQVFATTICKVLRVQDTSTPSAKLHQLLQHTCIFPGVIPPHTPSLATYNLGHARSGREWDALLSA
jgi:hypothetical protein